MARPDEIQRVDVVLTAGCNLRCGYCYQNDKKPRSMDWDTLRASADLLLGSSRPEVRMLFIGGEPLLEFPLIRRAVEYIEAARPPQPGRPLRDRHERHPAPRGAGRLPGRARLRRPVELRRRAGGAGPPGAGHVRRPGPAARPPAGGPSRLLLDQAHRRPHARSLDDSRTSPTRSTTSWEGRAADHGDPRAHPPVRPGGTELMAELDAQFARIFRACLRHYRRTGEVPFKLFLRSLASRRSARPRLGDVRSRAGRERPPSTSTARCTAA